MPKKTKAAAKKAKKDKDDHDEEPAPKKTKAAAKKAKKDEDDHDEELAPKKTKAPAKKAKKDDEPEKETKASKKSNAATAKGKKENPTNGLDEAPITTAQEAVPKKTKAAPKKAKSKVDSANIGNSEERAEDTATDEIEAEPVKPTRGRKKAGEAIVSGEPKVGAKSKTKAKTDEQHEVSATNSI